MAAVSNITLIEQREQPVLSVRKTIHFDHFAKTAKEAFEAIAAYARENALLFSGCPFVCYHNADLTDLDVELGFPVAAPQAGNGTVTGRTIPSHKAACGIFLGPYTQTDPLMMEIFSWIGQNGYQPHGDIYHYYLNDENRPESELLTQIAVAVL